MNPKTYNTKIISFRVSNSMYSKTSNTKIKIIKFIVSSLLTLKSSSFILYSVYPETSNTKIIKFSVCKDKKRLDLLASLPLDVLLEGVLVQQCQSLSLRIVGPVRRHKFLLHRAGISGEAG